MFKGRSNGIKTPRTWQNTSSTRNAPLLPGPDESGPLSGPQNSRGDWKFCTVVFKLLAEMGVLRGVVDQQDLLDETRGRAIDNGVYGSQKSRPSLIVENYHYCCRGKTRGVRFGFAAVSRKRSHFQVSSGTQVTK